MNYFLMYNYNWLSLAGLGLSFFGFSVDPDFEKGGLAILSGILVTAFSMYLKWRSDKRAEELHQQEINEKTAEQKERQAEQKRFTQKHQEELEMMEMEKELLRNQLKESRLRIKKLERDSIH